jgi:hypothetical protein
MIFTLKPVKYYFNTYVGTYCELLQMSIVKIRYTYIKKCLFIYLFNDSCAGQFCESSSFWLITTVCIRMYSTTESQNVHSISNFFCTLLE